MHCGREGGRRDHGGGPRKGGKSEARGGGGGPKGGKGKPRGPKGAPGPKVHEARPPRKEKPIDPDNPFAAALMGLRDKS